MRTALIAAACAWALFAGSANANLLVDGSFEYAKDFVDNYGGDTMNLGVGSTTMKDWTVIGTTSGAGLAWIGPTNPYGLKAEQGSYFLDLTEEHISGPYGGVEQTFATVAGDKYKVTFWLGSSPQWGIQDGLDRLGRRRLENVHLDQQRQPERPLATRSLRLHGEKHAHDDSRCSARAASITSASTTCP